MDTYALNLELSKKIETKSVISTGGKGISKLAMLQSLFAKCSITTENKALRSLSIGGKMVDFSARNTIIHRICKLHKAKFFVFYISQQNFAILLILRWSFLLC